MRRIALRSLLHDRGKLAASLAGVAFAATLVLVQVGIYAGFLKTSAAVVHRVGGDVWVVPRGTEVADNSEVVGGAGRSLAMAHPCVRGVRGVVLSFVGIRKPRGSRDAVMLLGFERDPRREVPWRMVRGLPQDLDAPLRVAVDIGDLRKLQIEQDPIGTALELNGVSTYITGLSAGVRSFTLTPYVFASVDTARRVMRMKPDQASYWVADLRDPACADDVIRAVRAHPDLEAHTAARFAEMTQDYWVAGSGAGAALGFSALLGLVVGVVIVGQTLYAVTREHLRELATLKAVGASDIEITGFVAWQALLLAGVGGALGLANTFAVQRAIDRMGITVELSPAVLGVGAGAVALMCALASLWSVRAVLALEAAEVFK